MTNWNPRANDLFLKVLDLPASSERQRYLNEACASDSALRAEVEALLAAHAESASFLEAPAVARIDTTAAPTFTERLGSVIGPYKLKEQIGEGGMGLVFVAEQHEPVRRKVALKLIKPGMDSRQVIARFEAERQALALMNHANIAKVFDGGETPSGRPYFVMELVKGVPITEYCDQNRLTPRARLELFGQVCAAVQHAHHKGIIHRDLKPSNVIVSSHDGTPVVKVIDFGVAKAIGQQLTDKSVYTNISQFIGTPLYMSPEQAGQSDLDIDTRTDIYALGVLLYELLTGTTPFDKERLSHASYDEIRRLIREEEPPKPSTRLSTLNQQIGSTLSAQRQTNPRQLCLLLRGELDWIVMKALEKDRNRRYESASALAADVERYLKDERVEACPPSAAYRFRKFARKRKVALSAFAALFVVTLVVAGSAGWFLRDRSARESETTRIVEAALDEAVQWQRKRNIVEALGAAKRAAAVLAAGTSTPDLERRVAARLADLKFAMQLEEFRASRTNEFRNPLEKTDRAYGETFRDFGIDVDALSAGEAGRLIRGRSIGDEVAAALDDWYVVARQMRTKRESRIEHLLRVALAADSDPGRSLVRNAILKKDGKFLVGLLADLPELPPSTILLLARVLEDTGHKKESLSLAQESQRRYPSDFWIANWLAWAHAKAGNQDEAIRFFTVTTALRRTANGYRALGDTLLAKDRLDEAIVAFREGIGLSAIDPLLYSGLIKALTKKGQPDAAAAVYREVSAAHPESAEVQKSLGHALIVVGRIDDAIAAFDKAIRLKPDYAEAHYQLAEVYTQITPQRDKAIAALRDTIRCDSKHAPAHNQLGILLSQRGELDEGIELFRELTRIEPELATGHNNLGFWLAIKGKYDEAIAAYRQAIHLSPSYLVARNNLCRALAAKGQFEEAIAAAHEGIRISPAGDFMMRYALAAVLKDQRKLPEAVAVLRGIIEDKPHHEAYHRHSDYLYWQQKLPEAEAVHRKVFEYSPRDAGTHHAISNILYVAGKLDDAEAASRQVIASWPKYANSFNTLAQILHAQGRLDEAADAQAQALKLDAIDAENNWGRLLAGQGRFLEARDAFKRGQRPGTAITSDMRWVERSIELDAQLTKILNGEAAPADNRERLELAEFCQLRCRQLYKASARFYSEAFRADPKLVGELRADIRYCAACAAAQSGSGLGNDAANLGPQEYASLRAKARAWLRADLSGWRAEFDSDPVKAKSGVIYEMQQWQRDASLACVRDAEALANLPEAERQEWRRFWEDVAELERQAVAAQPR
jgi:serine/threonine protein kinase/tetratricopeptide (TPR) repeat protein